MCRLEDFNCCFGFCYAQCLVASDKRSIQSFGERQVGSVVGRKVIPKLPDAGQQHRVRKSIERQVGEVMERLFSALSGQDSGAAITTKDLRHLQVQEVGGA